MTKLFAITSSTCTFLSQRQATSIWNLFHWHIILNTEASLASMISWTVSAHHTNFYMSRTNQTLYHDIMPHNKQTSQVFSAPRINKHVPTTLTPPTRKPATTIPPSPCHHTYTHPQPHRKPHFMGDRYGRGEIQILGHIHRTTNVQDLKCPTVTMRRSRQIMSYTAPHYQ